MLRSGISQSIGPVSCDKRRGTCSHMGPVTAPVTSRHVPASSQPGKCRKPLLQFLLAEHKGRTGHLIWTPTVFNSFWNAQHMGAVQMLRMQLIFRRRNLSVANLPSVSLWVAH